MIFGGGVAASALPVDPAESPPTSRSPKIPLSERHRQRPIGMAKQISER